MHSSGTTRPGRARRAPARPSGAEADGHHEVPEVVALTGHEPGTQRGDELQVDLLLALQALEAIAQEARVEADVERVAAEVAGERLAELADVLRACRHRQLTRGEREADRRVAAREQLGPRDHVAQVLPPHGHDVLEGVGEQLAVVRELPVDASRRQRRAAAAEQHLVRVDRHVDGVVAGVARDPRELGERPRRHDRLDLLRRAAGKRGVLHRHAVGVGRRHREAARGELELDARQHGARLVPGRRALHCLERTQEALALDPERALLVELGQARKVLHRVGAERRLCVSGLDLHLRVAVALLDRDLVVRRLADQVGHQAARQHDLARRTHLRVERGSHRELHVGGGQHDRVLRRLGAHVHAREYLHRRAGREASADGLERALELIVRADDVHGVPLWWPGESRRQGPGARACCSVLKERSLLSL